QAVKASASRAASRAERVIFYPLRCSVDNKFFKTSYGKPLNQPSAKNSTISDKKYHCFLAPSLI
ncbi:hypothetical protein, partial [Methylobacillus methanolivorans]